MPRMTIVSSLPCNHIKYMRNQGPVPRPFPVSSVDVGEVRHAINQSFTQNRDHDIISPLLIDPLHCLLLYFVNDIWME